jgi:hypothetical protein
MGNGAVVNTETLNQMFLISMPELESETTSTQSSHATRNQKSGDIGELFFDAECARLNLAPFRPALTNGAIDRLLLLPSGEIKKIHVKAAVFRNTELSRNKTCFAYQFSTANSAKKADYYFCVGLSQGFTVSACWWIPWSIRDSIFISANSYKYNCYIKCPFVTEESEVLACQ